MDQREIINKIESAINVGIFEDKLLIFPVLISRDKSQKTHIGDYEIRYKNTPVALIEIRTRLVIPENIANRLKYDINTRYRIYIVTDGVTLNVFDISKNSSSSNSLYKGTDFLMINNQLQFLFDEPKSTDEIESQVTNIFTELTQKLIGLKKERLLKDSVYTLPVILKADISSAISIDHVAKIVKSRTSNGDDDKNLEYILFDLLVDDPWRMDRPRLVYRYTTFDAIFSTLHYLSYRLNGIQGMNDQTEGIFILKEFFNDQNLEEDSKEINQRLNDVFISSCSMKKDNLTMWRLYGDNSKGASLTIEVNDSLKSPFLVKKISYFQGQKDRLVREISFATAQLKEIGYKLDRNAFSLVPFFLKSNHFSTEEEVRILFDKSKHGISNQTVKFDWGISNPYTIVRPFVDIKLLIQSAPDNSTHNDFLPIKIKEVILGPNCPFGDKNVFQIKSLLTTLGLHNVNVIRSKIDKDTYIG